MSSGTSTSVAVAEGGGGNPDPTSDRGERSDHERDGRLQPAQQGLQPWQLFVLATLVIATAAIFVTRAEGISGVVLLTLLIATAALVGVAALQAVRPLVTEVEDRTRVIGQRTREALEREKTLALRALKELEFDRAMGKLSDADFQEMSTRLRGRAARLIRQLDSAEGYRSRIERDLAKRLTKEPGERGAGVNRPESAVAARVCDACATPNDGDARFCKECGAKL
jgi:hypothetical protein